MKFKYIRIGEYFIKDGKELKRIPLVKTNDFRSYNAVDGKRILFFVKETDQVKSSPF